MKTILYVVNEYFTSPEDQFYTKTVNDLLPINSYYNNRLGYKCDYILLLEDGKSPHYLKNRRDSGFAHSRDEIFEMMLRADNI